MDRHGARKELISELRLIGPRCSDAAEAMGVTIRFAHGLPGVFVVDLQNSLVITNDSDDVLVWAALAQVMALELGLEVDVALCLEVAAIICRKSGVFSALRIA